MGVGGNVITMRAGVSGDPEKVTWKEEKGVSKRKKRRNSSGPDWEEPGQE